MCNAKFFKESITKINIKFDYVTSFITFGKYTFDNIENDPYVAIMNDNMKFITRLEQVYFNKHQYVCEVRKAFDKLDGIYALEEDNAGEKTDIVDRINSMNIQADIKMTLLAKLSRYTSINKKLYVDCDSKTIEDFEKDLESIAVRYKIECDRLETIKERHNVNHSIYKKLELLNNYILHYDEQGEYSTINAYSIATVYVEKINKEKTSMVEESEEKIKLRALLFEYLDTICSKINGEYFKNDEKVVHTLELFLQIYKAYFGRDYLYVNIGYDNRQLNVTSLDGKYYEYFETLNTIVKYIEDEEVYIDNTKVDEIKIILDNLIQEYKSIDDLYCFKHNSLTRTTFNTIPSILKRR